MCWLFPYLAHFAHPHAMGRDYLYYCLFVLVLVLHSGHRWFFLSMSHASHLALLPGSPLQASWLGGSLLARWLALARGLGGRMYIKIYSLLARRLEAIV